MINFLLAVILNIFSYVCIWTYGRIGGTTKTLEDAILAVFHPKALVLIILGNIFFATSLFFYFKSTDLAIPISMAVGVLTAFFLGVIFIDDVSLDWIKFIGVLAIVLGIYLLFK